MKKLLPILSLVLFATGVAAQNGTIRGTVISNNNTPIEYVTITIGKTELQKAY